MTCKIHVTLFYKDMSSLIETLTEQDGLAMEFRQHGLWRPLATTPTHVSKASSCVKYPGLSTDPDRIHPENVTPYA